VSAPRAPGDGAAPRPSTVAFVTTEHFTLQGARTAAITESTSRATIFIGSVSAGLVALGLIATATRIGTAFYAFGLILLSTLSFIGFVTCDRVLQSGIEELHYAERIARLRAYYFDFAPELTHYLASVADEEASAAQLEALFTAQREAEWGEFLSDCGKYETELAGEIAKGKPTLAELDEEEQSLDRLRRWYRTIRARDLFGAPRATVAERRLKECTEALEDFAEQVYQARERP